ncbi:RNA polymerase sigma factor [Labrys sp. (in: a-proteobacteria)]|uniref:RNA polymerase sigma factor n=1 Tax=Labrys sp. (in: a-proteobacteria) TaxID=1917972 RepID=UPI0039E44D26
MSHPGLQIHPVDDLIDRAIRREPEAIRTITTQHNRRLYRIARSILRDDDEAEEAVQAAYMRAFAALPAFRRDSSLATWLTRIAMNEALGRVRARRPAIGIETGRALLAGEVIPFPIQAMAADPERTMAQRQIQSLLEMAIDELPAIYRVVLMARLVEEMSLEETAALLGLRPETVKTRLHRARRLLREALERQAGPHLMDTFPFDGWRCERMTRAVIEKILSSP